jgi:uncharacterized membrane protein
MKKLLFFGLLFGAQALMASEGEGITMDVIIKQIGKFHPLVLHFPAALVPMTFLVIFLSKFIKGQEFWRKTIPYFVYFSTLMAVVASTLGLLLAADMGDLEGMLLNHKHLTLTFTAYMIGFSAFMFFSKPNFEDEPPMSWVIISGLGAALLGAAAHFGGESVHGDLFIILEYL